MFRVLARVGLYSILCFGRPYKRNTSPDLDFLPGIYIFGYGQLSNNYTGYVPSLRLDEKKNRKLFVFNQYFIKVVDLNVFCF